MDTYIFNDNRMIPMADYFYLLTMKCDHHGVLHNHGSDSFFQKDKRCVSPKLWLKSILLFYKDLLEIKLCQQEAIFEQIF